MSTISTECSSFVDKAHKTQLCLSRKIVFKNDFPKKIQLIAGVDVAYSWNKSIGAVAVLDHDTLELKESRTDIHETRFPYIPTLLSYREIPPEVASIRKLRTTPDVFLVDGHGYAHPYNCGVASHLGLVIKKPTIGVAKNKLFGKIENTGNKEDFAILRNGRKIVGASLTTKSGCKPIYVSVGHMITLRTAVRIVSHCTRNNRTPEPILMAHRIANEEKRKTNNYSENNRGPSETRNA